MRHIIGKLSAAPAHRYRIERELGKRGMAASRQPAAVSHQPSAPGSGATSRTDGLRSMLDSIQRLTAALFDRYRIETELGAGGMAFSRQRSPITRFPWLDGIRCLNR